MELQEIGDRLEITDILMQYYRGLDRTDYGLIGSCFWDDTVVDYGPFFRGRAGEFVEWLAGPDAIGAYAGTFHFAGNVIVELAGDTAYTEVYAMPQHMGGAEYARKDTFVTTWLRYVDRFERRRAMWKIADRKVVVEWMKEEMPTTVSQMPAEWSGRRDRSDLCYVR